MSGPQEQFLILTEAKATSPQFLYALSNAVSVLRGDMLATPGKMQRLTVVCGCMLLVIAASTSLVEANGGGKVPYYPRECVGKGPDECCKEKSNIDFQACEYHRTMPFIVVITSSRTSQANHQQLVQRAHTRMLS